MISIYRLIFVLLLGSILLIYSFFWGGFLELRKETASIMLESIRNDMSEIAYTLAKSTSGIKEIAGFKAFLDRKAANNDLITSVVVVHGSRILLSTDPSIRIIPRTENISLDVSEANLESLLTKDMFSSDFRIFDQVKPVNLRLLLTIDQSHIEDHLEKNLTRLVFMQGVPPIIVILILWLFLNRSVVKPLVKLRAYAYDTLSIPDSFRLKELESIRLTMEETYARLESERDELYHLSTTDELSGLANRNSLSDRLGRLISESDRNNTEFALLFLDLDNFKSVNDTLGHKSGDILIKLVAEAIKDLVRVNDIIARVGGDEFVIVLSHYKAHAELVHVLDRILSRMRQPWYVNQNQFFLSASVGIALYPLNGADAVALLKNADIAMYEAKKNGRNQYRFFSDSLNQAILDEVALDREMRSALHNNEFELFYQPKVQVSSGRITGAEALLRWNHPSKGVLSPLLFVSIAERSGFIVELGHWIVRQAATQQVAWKNAGIGDISIAVNVSPNQLYEKEFYYFMNKTVTESGIDPSRLDVEITESTLLENTEKNLKVLKQVHELGVTISLDDFGTGYSSLAYLKTFPVDTLKIDKMFVDDYASKSGAIFLQTIVTMGKTLHISVVSEGVESSEQLQYMKSVGCDLYQGYHCSKPLKAVEFENLLHRKARELGDNVVDICR